MEVFEHLWLCPAVILQLLSTRKLSRTSLSVQTLHMKPVISLPFPSLNARYFIRIEKKGLTIHSKEKSALQLG